MSRIESLSQELAALNSSLLRSKDDTEAIVARIQPQLAELSKTGLLPREVLLGSTYQRGYDPDQGVTDSGQVVQAALLLPEGFGVCLWDSEEFVSSDRSPDALERDARLHFQPFDRCSAAEKTLVGQNAEELFEELMELARAAASRLEPRPTIRAEDFFADNMRIEPTR